MSIHSEDYYRKQGLPSDLARRMAGNWVIGDTIGYGCEIIQILGGPGKSGMGTVYICHDYSSEEIETVAVKTLQHRFLENRALVERFKWEAETWVRLGKHLNIVEAKRVETHNETPYIYLEYVAGDRQYGSSLSGWIYNGGLYQNGKPYLPFILDFAIQFCHGMMHAEKKFNEIGKPFVHRDIKPANILVTRDRVVKVTDFGLVKAFADLDEDIPETTVGDGVNRRLSLSKAGGVCGTPPYMSPEQCLRIKDIDVRADIYAFGCVLYEMLTRRLVFDGKTMEEFVRHHLKTKPNSPNVQRDLDAVVLKCLEKRPANRYADFKELEGALSSIYRKLTGKEVKEPDAVPLVSRELNNKGLSLLKLGLKEEAVACFLEALKTNQDDVEIHINLGDAYKAQGKLDEALAECREALKIDPDDIVAHRNLAYIYQSQGKLDEVVREHKEILRMHPDDASAHSEMGNVYQGQGKFDEAVMEYLEAFRIEPNKSYSHSNLAGVYAAQGKLDEAIREYQEALRIEPNGAFTHHFLGDVYKTLGKLDEAAREYREELRISPIFSYLHSDLGEVYQAQGKLDDAVREYREELKINPNYGYVHVALGGAYKAQGKLDEAIRECREALRISPDYALAHYNLALDLELVGKRSEALQQWKQYLAVAQKVQDEKAHIVEAQSRMKELGSRVGWLRRRFKA